MKTCVFITGTNAVGKSSLAWAIINRFGGVDRITNDVTYCADGSVCLAGAYGTTRFGGVDRITNDKGSSCTSRLAEVVEEGLRHADTMVCEGSFLDTFGLNLTNAMFKAECHLIVNLYTDPKTIYERLMVRSQGKYGNGNRSWEQIFKKQKQSMVAAQKWHSIGVKVLQLDSSKYSVEQELELVLKTIDELCGRRMMTK
jgi:deoxyadenosine/deoxycytidine kinase